MAAKTILSVAVTGNQTTLQQHPGLPCTPKQIADAAIQSGKAGAAIAHIHVRYEDGRPSMELQHYREAVERIRGESDIIINLTTGPGQRFVPSDDEPKIAGPGTTLVHPLRRVEHIVALRPEICSLDLNTMWSGSAAVINSPRNVKIMAEAIYAAGTMPELEVFDSGDINLAIALLKEGVLKSPPLFQIVTGISYGFAGNPEALFYARSMLPKDAQWAGFGIGRMAFPMVAQAYLLGGHVRVGLEDAINIRKGQLAASNAQMVEKAVRILDELGAEVATVSDACAILGLRDHGLKTSHENRNVNLDVSAA